MRSPWFFGGRSFVLLRIQFGFPLAFLFLAILRRLLELLSREARTRFLVLWKACIKDETSVDQHFVSP
jgi:hypothetical protein